MIDIKRHSLLAIAAAGLISPAAFAAIVDDGGDGPSQTFFYSDEYLSTATDELIDAGALSVIIEAEYAVGDIITWSVSGGAIDGGFPTSVTSACDDAGKPADEAGITLGLLSDDADGAVYRVTEVDNACGATTVGAQLNFGNLQLVATDVDAANTITASFMAETGTGLALDTSGGAARSGDLVITASQYAPEVGLAFDGVIDVEADRESFEFGNTYDEAVWFPNPFTGPDVDGIDGSWYASVPPDGQEVTITGPFGFIVDTDETTDGVQPNDFVLQSSCSVDVLGGAVTATSITATCDSFGDFFGIDNFFNVDAGGAVAIDDGSFSSTHVFTFNGISDVENTITVANINLGKWTLNGFSADVAYMPFQTGIGQVIYLANRGPQTGAITIEWIDQYGNSGEFNIGVIEAGSTRAIGPAINQGLPAAQRNGGRLALTIIANVPACDAQLNAQYNVSGDRAFSVSTNNCPVSADFGGF